MNKPRIPTVEVPEPRELFSRPGNSSMRFYRFAMVRSIQVAMLFLLVWPRVAHADKVDRLIAQLRTSEDYKIRLSAALNLAKVRNQRVVPVFVEALRDSDKTVRGVSAASLGRTVDSTTPTELRRKVAAELKRVASADENGFVRRQAQKALEAVERLGAPKPAEVGGVYVNIGEMSANIEADGQKMRQLMRQETQKTFQKNTKAMPTRWSTTWPGTGLPTKQQLQLKKITGFHVDGTLTELKTTEKGAATIVDCKVSMLLATYPEKSMFGFLKGGAKVQAGTSKRDIDFAKEDCVLAVVEDLVSKKIIPTIRTRVQ